MELNAKERRRLKRQAARAAQGPAAVESAAAKEYAEVAAEEDAATRWAMPGSQHGAEGCWPVHDARGPHENAWPELGTASGQHRKNLKQKAKRRLAQASPHLLAALQNEQARAACAEAALQEERTARGEDERAREAQFAQLEHHASGLARDLAAVGQASTHHWRNWNGAEERCRKMQRRVEAANMQETAARTAHARLELARHDDAEVHAAQLEAQQRATAAAVAKEEEWHWRLSHGVGIPKICAFAEVWWENLLSGVPAKCCFAEFLTVLQERPTALLQEAAGGTLDNLTFRITLSAKLHALGTNRHRFGNGDYGDKADPLSKGAWAGTALAVLAADHRSEPAPPFTVVMGDSEIVRVLDIGQRAIDGGMLPPPFLDDAIAAGVKWALVSFDARLGYPARRAELDSCPYRMNFTPFHQPMLGARPPAYDIGDWVEWDQFGEGHWSRGRVCSVEDGQDGGRCCYSVVGARECALGVPHVIGIAREPCNIPEVRVRRLRTTVQEPPLAL